MKYILAALLACMALAFSGCGATASTPEFIDPSDPPMTSEPFSGPAAPGSSQTEPSQTGPSQMESSQTDSSEVLPSSEPSLLPPLVTFWEEYGEVSADGQFLLQRYQLRCEAGGIPDAGTLDYCLVQLAEASPAADRFNAYYQADLQEWIASVEETVRDNAALAEDGLPLQRYSVSFSAEASERGGIISVLLAGEQSWEGEAPFPFVMNRCFDAQTGAALTLWDLFAADQQTASGRLLEVLREQAADPAVQAGEGLAADAWRQVGDFFSPADFSCGEDGFYFYLWGPALLANPDEGRLVRLTVPYSAVEDLLAYPLDQPAP